MKAFARQAAGVLLLALCGAAAASERASQEPSSSNLPAGLPALPSLGERMQRDLRSGLALHGFDPVAYYVSGRAMAGRPDYEVLHEGIVWRFASAGNRDAFLDAPEVYAPLFAGFDGAAVADGRAVESDPRLFLLVGSRLVLFRSPENRERFAAEAALRQRSAGAWPQVARQLAR